MKKIKIDSLSDLPQVAQAVIDSLDGRSVVVFRAGMGAGKTTLISRIVALLGAEDTVTSPTFALVNQYEGAQRRIYHFDFYRIERVEEVFDFGYEEYFYSGDLCLVEWPEKIEALIPDDVMTVKIEVEDDGQRIFTID
jgi:tRNA threonylcarbamoyladenosine biosynthesis protein TsaE